MGDTSKKKKPATDAADVDGMTEDECREALKQLLDEQKRSGQVRYITRPKSQARKSGHESHKAAYAASEHRHLKSSYARIVTSHSI